MKKVILGISALALMLSFSGCDGVTDTNSYPLAQPDAEYELDTWGSNSEVYEFTPKTAPNTTCIFVMLDSGGDMGLQCFPKYKAAVK